MAGLKIKKGAPGMPPQPGQQPQQQAPALDATKMNIPALLGKQLNLGPQEVAQLLTQLASSKNPQEAVDMLRQANRNPATMQQAPQAQQLAQGLRLAK